MELDKLRPLLARGSDVSRAAGCPEVVDAKIVSVGDLVRIVEREHLGSYQHRGQRCGNWRLLPSLTRPGSAGTSGLAQHECLHEKQQHILKEFGTRLVAYRGNSPENELRLAILAQHHGAPTRLLDWTMNPLAALFFAIEDADTWQERCCECGVSECTPVVWAAAAHRYRVSDFPARNFRDLEERPVFVIPDRHENRAAVQSSIFALWRDPRRPFDELPGVGRLWRMRTVRGQNRHVLWALHCLGIDRETLFPDPDGLGRYLAWKHRAIHRDEFERQGRPEPREG